MWYSGAYLLETVPTVLHILMRHAQDPEEAIVRAVNDSKDNDTIAAVVGATVGALHGEAALPKRWRDGLLGRVIADVDDRRARSYHQTRPARRRAQVDRVVAGLGSLPLRANDQIDDK